MDMSNIIPVLSNNKLSITSLEISELVDSRHDDVKRSIDRLVNQSIIIQPPLADVQSQDTLGRTRTTAVYNFAGDQGKRDSIVIVAQLSPKFTARLVDRWQELEEYQSKPVFELPDFTSPIIAARAWADEVEKKQAALEKLDHADNEIERLQGVCNTISAQFTPGMSPSAFCRQLNGVNVQQVQNSLAKRGLLIRSINGFKAASAYRDNYFAERVEEYRGSNRVSVLLTKKGAKFIYKLYLSKELPMKVNWNGQMSHMLETEANSQEGCL